jgi:hypothetical protein
MWGRRIKEDWRDKPLSYNLRELISGFLKVGVPLALLSWWIIR